MRHIDTSELSRKIGVRESKIITGLIERHYSAKVLRHLINISCCCLLSGCRLIIAFWDCERLLLAMIKTLCCGVGIGHHMIIGVLLTGPPCLIIVSFRALRSRMHFSSTSICLLPLLLLQPLFWCELDGYIRY